MEISIGNKKFNVPEVYQPVFKTDILSKRSCEDRLRTILQVEEGYTHNSLFKDSFIDWGCNFGFFCFELSNKTDNIIYGIDYDKTNIYICNEVKKINKIKNINFIHGKVPEYVPDNV